MIFFKKIKFVKTNCLILSFLILINENYLFNLNPISYKAYFKNELYFIQIF